MDFDFGGPAIQPGIVDHDLVDRNECRRNFLAALFALGESGGKALENLGRQKVSQNLAVPFGECGDNHLIGGFGALGKGLDGKGRIGGSDGVEPRPGLRTGLGIWFPSVVLSRRNRNRRLGCSRQGDDSITRVAAARIVAPTPKKTAWRAAREWIAGRFFGAIAGAEDRAQLPHHESGEKRENNRRHIE